MSTAPLVFEPRLGRRRVLARLFAGGCIVVSLFALVILAVLLGRMWMEGAELLSFRFLNAVPSTLDPLISGIKPALWGTIWLIGLTALMAVPVGVSAAIYLEEYAAHNRITKFIQVNIANLAGVPSIVYGILGLAIFVRWLHLGSSLLSGALTMSLLILPVIIIASQEALAAVPNSIRLAAYALGATRWQTIRSHVLPAAMPGIMTGIILALSRAIGEAAPLIVIGAVAFSLDVPASIWDSFVVLPIQIYQWADSPHEENHRLAATAIIVLLAVLLSMNALAVGIRAWYQRHRLW